MQIKITKRNIKKSLIILLLILVSFGSAVYFYTQFKNTSTSDSEQEIAETVEKVSDIFMLPDEIPSLATVTQKELLAEQPFFNNAQNGDKVLIYVKAGKAILYRPSEHKIIEVAPINAVDTETQKQKTTQQQESNKTEMIQNEEDTSQLLSVVLYNGSQTVGITTQVATQLESRFNWIDIAERESAQRTDYETTVIIDLKGSYTESVLKIAEELNAKVEAVIPDSEIVPESDILIIIGNDYSK